jgi:hypothetical protein
VSLPCEPHTKHISHSDYSCMQWALVQRCLPCTLLQPWPAGLAYRSPVWRSRSILCGVTQPV